jgi:hypothetical protein
MVLSDHSKQGRVNEPNNLDSTWWKLGSRAFFIISLLSCSRIFFLIKQTIPIRCLSWIRRFYSIILNFLAIGFYLMITFYLLIHSSRLLNDIKPDGSNDKDSSYNIIDAERLIGFFYRVFSCTMLIFHQVFILWFRLFQSRQLAMERRDTENRLNTIKLSKKPRNT